MLQMNVVDRQINQKVRLLLRLEKFAAHRGRATEPEGRSKQDGLVGESDEHPQKI
jgi:hypothetical protein